MSEDGYQGSTVDWDGLHPHHFLDWANRGYPRRAMFPMLDEAWSEVYATGKTFRDALHDVVVSRYVAVVVNGETCPETHKPWRITDIPAVYRGAAEAQINPQIDERSRIESEVKERVKANRARDKAEREAEAKREKIVYIAKKELF